MSVPLGGVAHRVIFGFYADFPFLLLLYLSWPYTMYPLY